MSSRAKQRRPEDRVIIRLLQAAAVCFARIYHRLTVRSPCPLPPRGAAIVVSNHTSGLDPLLIQAVCPRLIHWLTATEFTQRGGLRWLFRAIGAIPVQRSGRDLAATREALRALHEGRVIGIFPEGRLETSRALMPFQTGIALVAIKSGVPVYPVFLDGTQRGQGIYPSIIFPNRATIAFGPAVQFDRRLTSREALESATDAIRRAVAELAHPPIGTVDSSPTTPESQQF